MKEYVKEYVIGIIFITILIVGINGINLNSKPIEITDSIALYSSFISILIAIVNLRESNLRFEEQIKVSEENLKKKFKS